MIKNNFPSLFQYFDDKALKLLRKGVFLYDYMDENWKNKLKKKELQDIKYFHSSLTNTKCSSSDYSYAKEIYNCFKCKNIKDYNDLYVKTDVLLLTDAFACYRKNSNNKYVNSKFDKKRDKESYIVSLDVNSLYSLALCYKLPYEEPKI